MNIEALAREADPAGEDGKLYHMALLTPETLRAFARLVLEEAAQTVETLNTGGIYGLREALADAIRSLVKEAQG